MRKKWILPAIFLMLIFVLGACGEEKILLEQYADADSTNEEAESETEAVPEYICVHVCGAVATPGVYELPTGSRIYEALDLAGGFDEQAECDAVNLVELLSDGQQVRIPFIGENKAEDDSGLIDINSADITTLCEIPGIGESRAQAILDYREENGDFQSVEELMQVPGIKEGIVARISAYVKCGD